MGHAATIPARLVAPRRLPVAAWQQRSHPRQDADTSTALLAQALTSCTWQTGDHLDAAFADRRLTWLRTITRANGVVGGAAFADAAAEALANDLTLISFFGYAQARWTLDADHTPVLQQVTIQVKPKPGEGDVALISRLHDDYLSYLAERWSHLTLDLTQQCDTAGNTSMLIITASRAT